MSKSSLINRYQDLKTKIARGKNLTEQQRGFQLKKLLYDLIEFEKLNPVYTEPKEEDEIFIGFEFRYRYFLLETLWLKKPLAETSEGYSFSSWLSLNMLGTLGIFVSMSNFENYIVTQFEKTSKAIILFGQNDIDFCFHPEHSFSEVLSIKLRKAAFEGVLFYDVEEHFSIKKASEIMNF